MILESLKTDIIVIMTTDSDKSNSVLLLQSIHVHFIFFRNIVICNNTSLSFHVGVFFLCKGSAQLLICMINNSTIIHRKYLPNATARVGSNHVEPSRTV